MKLPGKTKKCPTCKGKKKVQRKATVSGTATFTDTCQTCKGIGRVPK